MVYKCCLNKMLFKFQKIVGCNEPWVKNRDTNRIVSLCIVTALGISKLYGELECFHLEYLSFIIFPFSCRWQGCWHTTSYLEDIILLAEAVNVRATFLMVCTVLNMSRIRSQRILWSGWSTKIQKKGLQCSNAWPIPSSGRLPGIKFGV